MSNLPDLISMLESFSLVFSPRSLRRGREQPRHLAASYDKHTTVSQGFCHHTKQKSPTALSSLEECQVRARVGLKGWSHWKQTKDRARDKMGSDGPVQEKLSGEAEPEIGLGTGTLAVLLGPV